jgi:hypothetical protein
MNRTQPPALVRRLSDLRRADIALVGGKNASLGEMISALQGAKIKVPGASLSREADRVLAEMARHGLERGKTACRSSSCARSRRT